ncbi:hypothetical protein DH2020_015859 [Rehmannia glutinosa]|uniref:Maf-like protein n=1 Tax=Rehmannia glutinosa TaxID=99300 RepID=A0ABR0WX44_REHGL
MEADGVAQKNRTFEIILGSSSMARREILAEMGYDFTIMTADIDEKSIRKEKPEDLVMALAEAKADAIMMRLKSSGQLEEISHPTLLITADTLHGFTDYSGGSAKVVGSVLVTNLVTGSRKGGWESAEVYFLDIPDEVVDSLVGTADCVMGLSKSLTEKLIQEAL